MKFNDLEQKFYEETSIQPITPRLTYSSQYVAWLETRLKQVNILLDGLLGDYRTK